MRTNMAWCSPPFLPPPYRGGLKPALGKQLLVAADFLIISVHYSRILRICQACVRRQASTTRLALSRLGTSVGILYASHIYRMCVLTDSTPLCFLGLCVPSNIRNRAHIRAMIVSLSRVLAASEPHANKTSPRYGTREGWTILCSNAGIVRGYSYEFSPLNAFHARYVVCVHIQFWPVYANKRFLTRSWTTAPHRTALHWHTMSHNGCIERRMQIHYRRISSQRRRRCCCWLHCEK